MEIKLLEDILISDEVSSLVKENEEVLFSFIPELGLSKGFNQNNEWHIYDVYDHTLKVLDNLPNNIILRYVGLFHDLGKVKTYTEDDNGVGHFFGHWEESRKIFLDFCKINNITGDLVDIVSRLIYYHDINFNKITESDLKAFLETFSVDDIKLLFIIKEADLLAQNTKFHYILDEYNELEERLIKLKNILEFICIR